MNIKNLWEHYIILDEKEQTIVDCASNLSKDDQIEIISNLQLEKIPSIQKIKFSKKDFKAKLFKYQENRILVVLEAEALDNHILSNISHEIRTPINAIISGLHLLEQLDLTKKQSDLVLMVKKSSHELQQIITDLLDISQIHSGELVVNKKPVNLTRYIKEAILSYKQKAQDKNISFTLSVQENIFVDIDKFRIIQILINLLENAIKFTNQGGVSCDISLKDSFLCLQVKDSGIGISKEILPSIFNLLKQGENPINKKHKGLGLGLNLTQELVTLLAGSIHVSSTINQGTCFKVKIPVTEVAPFEEECFTYNVFSKAKVLVVEDNETNRMVIEDILKDQGIRADFAENGEIGVNKALENQYDLILMDCHMPIKNGYDATKEILLTKPYQAIIAWSADLQKHNRIQCQSSGMLDFLEKPLNLELLNEILSKYLAPFIIGSKTKNLKLTDNDNTLFDDSSLESFFEDEEGDDQETIDFISKLVHHSFYTRAQEHWSIIEKAIQSQDKDLLKSTVHPFKSAGGQIGLMNFYQIGDDIDKKYIHSNWDVIKEQVLLFKESFDKSLPLLNVFLEKKNIKKLPIK